MSEDVRATLFIVMWLLTLVIAFAAGWVACDGRLARKRRSMTLDERAAALQGPERIGLPPKLDVPTVQFVEPDALDHVRSMRSSTTIPVRGSDWESELDWERRQGQAQLRAHPAAYRRIPDARAGEFWACDPVNGRQCDPCSCEPLATAGVLVIPDELSFPEGAFDSLWVDPPEIQHVDGCGLEHDPSRSTCAMRPAGEPSWTGDPGRA